jgi:hypothetical protein
MAKYAYGITAKIRDVNHSESLELLVHQESLKGDIQGCVTQYFYGRVHF